MRHTNVDSVTTFKDPSGKSGRALYASVCGWHVWRHSAGSNDLAVTREESRDELATD